MARRRALALLAAALAVTGPAALAGAETASATTRAPYCGQVWGSLPEDDPSGYGGHLVGVRAGRHACFDRLVLDVSADRPGFFVRYVDQVRQDGSGFVVPVRGGARLEVVVLARSENPAAPFFGNGEIIDTRGYRTFRQVADAGSFEGQTTIGLGVRARLPFRVFTLDGPGDRSRLVVDVGHLW